MFDTAMFILFCLGPAITAYVALRQEREAGGDHKRGGWKPVPRGGDDPGEGGPAR